MTDYKLSREEQETVIRGNAASHEWEIVTADPKIIRLMARRGYQQDQRENPWGYVSFIIPFDRVKVLRPEKRKMTEGQKANILKAQMARKTNTELLSKTD